MKLLLEALDRKQYLSFFQQDTKITLPKYGPIFYHSRNTNHISNPNPSDHVTRPRPSPTHLNTINLLALHPPSQTNDVTTIKITHIL
jgi:hypothetical protein